MKKTIVVLSILLGLAAAFAAGFGLGHRGAKAAPDQQEAEKKTAPVASVLIAPLRMAPIAEDITAYGAVVAPPNEISVVSVPFECRVTRIVVTPGQTVEANQALIEVEGSAATALAFEEARNAAAAADRDLQLVKQRFDQKLATNAELFAAENAQRAAQGRLRALEQAGAGGPRTLKAENAGIVSKVDVQLGQVVPIGGPLVEVAPHNRIEAKLGVEPEDVPFISLGQQAELHPMDDASAAAVQGKVRLISRRVEPTTRLVDVMVSLPKDSKLTLEGFVVALIPRNNAVVGLVAPRDAVLPGDGGQYTLFTLNDGKAVKHAVRIGVENDRFVQVLGNELKPGDPVIVVGNYELEDGMPVHAEPAAEPSETQPSPSETQPAATEPAPAGGSCP